MGNKKKGKILAVLLCGALIGTQIPGMTVAEGAAGYTGGICGHHPVHTAECGYQEAVPEQPCRHEHTKECYEYETSCVHEHTEECYPLVAVEAPAEAQEGTDEPAQPQTELVRGTEPTACIHVCSEDSGCVTKTLNCIHEDKVNADGSITYAVHDASCGYAPAVEGKECTFVCEICSAPEEKGIELISLSEAETEALTVQTGIAAAGSADSGPSAKTTEAVKEPGGTGPEEEETPLEEETPPEEGQESTEGENTEEKNPQEKTETGEEPEKEAGTAEGEGQTAAGPEEGTAQEPEKTADAENTDMAVTETVVQSTVKQSSGTSSETDEAAAAVQKQIDALPSVSEVEQMTKDEQKEVYDKAQDAADAYFDELTEGQQAQVDLARLMDLMNYFNGQVSTMAEVVNSGTGWTLDDAGVLTITSNNGITDWMQQEVSENEITKVFISDNVTGAINERLFMGSNYLTEVTIGNGVTSIGNNAFDYCRSLSEVTIGNGVTSIGDEAFNYCTSLSKVTIGNSVTSIGNNAFAYCRSLSEVTIPDSVTSIGNNAFKYCNSLSEVTIGNSVTSIGNNAFAYCLRLSEVTIPDSVTSIGNNAFEGCLSLSEVTIGNSVTSIGDQAFDCCDISEVKIPDSVKSIGSRAFFRCNDLTKVVLPKTAPASASIDSFDGLWNQINFIIPETSIGTGGGQYNLNDSPWNQIKKLNDKTIDNGKLVIGPVTVNLTEPQAEQPLAETVTCDTEGVLSYNITWTTGDEAVTAREIAEFGTTYTAEVTLSANTAATPIGYKFTDQTTVTLNRETVTGTAAADGRTLTFTKEYTTEELVVATVTIDGTSQNYKTLDEAFAAAANTTAMIELKKDASFSSTVTITGNVTFKGGDFTATSSWTGGLDIYVNGIFTMVSGTIDFNGVMSMCCSGGTVDISGGTISILSLFGGTADISGGTISSLSLGGGTADISGGTINSLHLFGGTADISGGTIDSLFLNGGTVTYSATGITLDESALPLTPGDTEELTAKVEQNTIMVNRKERSVPVTWTSSDTAVATVTPSDDGRTATVTAVGPGEAAITAAAGTPTAACKVTVKNTTTITNKDENGYQTSFIHGDTIPEPTESSFTIDGSDGAFSYQWYSGDHTSGELTPGDSVPKPNAAGTYTLVVATAETNTYTAGELRLLVTVEAAEYHITIPGSADAGGEEVSVSITENSTYKIGSNGKVRVTVSGGAQEGTVILTRQNDGEAPATITAALKNGTDESAAVLKDGATVAAYDAEGNLTEDTTGKLYVAAPEAAEGDVIPAGSYSGTVTFRISYETPQEEIDNEEND